MGLANERTIAWTERGWIPDALLRRAMRGLLANRLAESATTDAERVAEDKQRFVDALRDAPIALVPEQANEQHYEVPAAFFGAVLGPHRKYSCGYWPDGVTTLEDSEAAALRVTCERAGISDGQRVLDLGCGWGSVSLWIAAHYPNCQVTGVSNSNSQREWIEAEAQRRGLDNLSIITADMNAFDPGAQFNRVVSVEMFEHMRNWPRLFARIHDWLVPGGRFFMHVFTHRSAAYLFEDRGSADWMSRHFFSGGMMPSDDLALRFQDHLSLVSQWRWDGRHYEKTSNAWLATMDAREAQVRPILSETYGEAETQRWWMRWRMFFMACAELFGYENGQEWGVSHYLFERPRETA